MEPKNTGAVDAPELSAVMDVEAVAKRLTATTGAASSSYRRGLERGREWAANEAEWEHVELLAGVDYRDEADLGTTGWHRRYDSENVEDVAVALCELAKCTNFENAAQPEELFGEVPRTHTLIDGFLAGVVEVFEAVEHKIV